MQFSKKGLRIIGRVNKLLIFIITIFLILNISFITKAQVPQNRVTVFIIDTDIEDRYLQDNVKIDDKTKHGSLVTWIINRDISKDNINIIPIGVVDNNGNIQYSLYLAGLKEIIDYKRIHPRQRILVNISLGFTDKIGYDYIKELYDMNVQLIAAAGNNDSRQPVYPAGFSREVIAVANATREGKADSSNYGLYVDISAPGSLEYIESIYFPGQRLNRKFKFGGTSFSAPRVTALLASILSNDSNLTIKQAVEIMEETARPLESELYKKGLLGAGLINKDDALARVVENYHLQKYLKILAIITIIAIIIFMLWQIYKVFSILVFILLTIVLFPLLVIIGENIDYWLLKGGKYLPQLGIITILIYMINKLLILAVGKISNPAIILKLLSLPSPGLRECAKKRLIDITGEETVQILLKEISSTGNKSKEKILIKVLTKIDKPPLKSLFRYGWQNNDLSDFVAAKIATVNNKQLLIQLLLDYLHKNNYQARELAAEIFRKLDPELVLPVLRPLLQSEYEVDKEVILQIIESYGIQAGNVMTDVKKVFQESKDMWTRYQAVKTLYNISDDKESILSYLEDYVYDQQQLVRLEIEALLKSVPEGE